MITERELTNLLGITHNTKIPSRILSPEQLLNKIRSRCEPTDSGCLIWKGGKTSRGYGCITWKDVSIRVHRLVLCLKTGEYPKDKVACHRCDVPLCCAEDHLFWGTCLDNIRDSVVKGRFSHGESSGHSKLNIQSARQIVLLFESGVSMRELSERFGVSKSTIAKVAKGDPNERGSWAQELDGTKRFNSCPWCGSENVCVRTLDHVYAQCLDCSGRGPRLGLSEPVNSLALQARELWNQRT